MKLNPDNGDLYVSNDINQSVLVFANVGPKEFTRLQEYLATCQPRGARTCSRRSWPV